MCSKAFLVTKGIDKQSYFRHSGGTRKRRTSTKAGSRKQRNGRQKKAVRDKSKQRLNETKGLGVKEKEAEQESSFVSYKDKRFVSEKRQSRRRGASLILSEDPTDSKRSEIDEDPVARAAFKDFYRQFREKERRSFEKARHSQRLSQRIVYRRLFVGVSILSSQIWLSVPTESLRHGSYTNESASCSRTRVRDG